MTRPVRALAALIFGMVSVSANQASAAARDLEYLSVEAPATGSLRFRQGDTAISPQRFIAAVEQLKADPAFIDRLKQEQSVRGALTWSTIGLLALAPVLGTLYVIDHQRKPDGVFTLTWLTLSVADLAAIAGVGFATLNRQAQPLFSYEDAKSAAHAYNRSLDRQARPASPR